MRTTISIPPPKPDLSLMRSVVSLPEPRLPHLNRGLLVFLIVALAMLGAVWVAAARVDGRDDATACGDPSNAVGSKAACQERRR
jgi:hypothetical protein